MKKHLLLFSAILLFSFSSCTTDNAIEEMEESTKIKTLDIGSINDEGIVSIEKIVIDPSLVLPQSATPRNGGKQKMTGDFAYPNGTSYEISAIENPGGVHGESLVNRANGAITKMETICVCTEENEGVFGSIVTEIIEPGFLQLDYIVFSKLIDNGEGGNAPKDQTGSLLYFYNDWFNFYDSVEEFLVDINCSNFEDVTGFNFGGRIEIETGQIQVE